MSDNEKALTLKDAMCRTAKDLESGVLWTSLAIASIAELAGIDKRGTHSDVLIALSNKLDEENELAYEQGLRVGASITALRAAFVLAKGRGWPEPDDEDRSFSDWIDRCFVPRPCLGGVPVQMDDEFTADGRDDVYRCKGYAYHAGGRIDLINDVLIRIDLGRCARPVPRYVDVNNEPFNALDTVWDVETHEEGTVDDIDANGVHVHWVDTTIGDCYVGPERLTHEMPFLGADGVPLKVFELVWDAETGIAYTVAELPMPGVCDKVRLYPCGAKDGFSEYFELSRLTHTQPCTKEGE